MAEGAGVTLAWVGPDGQGTVLELLLAAIPTTVGALLADPAVRARLPVDPAGCGLAIFGRRVSVDAAVGPGDRLEILPPLAVDPKLARQRRVEVARARAADARAAGRQRARSGSA